MKVCREEDVMVWRCVGRRMSWCGGVCREEDVMV